MTDTLTAVLDDVLQSQKERAAEHERAYLTLVNEIAAGEKPTAKRAESVLAAAEKTTEHLRADVMLRQQRIRWKRDIADAAELQPAVDAIVAAIQEAHRKLAAAQAEHETTCRGLIAEHKVLMGKMPNAAAAREGLQRTMPQQIQGRIGELAAEQRKLNLTIKGHRDEAARYWAGQSSSTGPAPMAYSGFDKWTDPGEEWQTPAQKAENARCREKAREHTEAAEALLPRAGELETEIDLLHRRTVDEV